MKDTGQFSYWWGPDLKDRRVEFAKDFRPEYQANGDVLVIRARAAFSYIAGQHGIVLPEEEWASGWRPPSVNEATANAAKKSTHLTAEAGDRRDTVDGSLAWALMKDQQPLITHGLCMEHPAGTVVRAWERCYQEWKKTGKLPTPHPWCHVQSRLIGNRCYFPDAASVTEWGTFLKMGGHAGMTFNEYIEMRKEYDNRGRR